MLCMCPHLPQADCSVCVPICLHLQVLAQKLRPKGQPGFEILHRQASEIQSRINLQLLAKEEAVMKVRCSWRHPGISRPFVLL